MKLQILVPHYKEPWQVVKPLFDSISIQKNVDFNDFEVIVVDNSEDESFYLDTSILNSYNFNVIHIKDKCHNISTARNISLDASTAEYIMWCDCDDYFCSNVALNIIFNKMPFEMLLSNFYAEVYDEEEEKIKYEIKERNAVHCHGRVYSRKFIIDNNLRWNPKLLTCEDTCFNFLANTLVENQVNIDAPFYVWALNKNSITRKENFTLLHFTDYIDAVDEIIKQLNKRELYLNSVEISIKAIVDFYYCLNNDILQEDKNKEYLYRIEKRASKFVKKYRHNLSNISEEDFSQLINSSRKAACNCFAFEHFTFNQYIKRMMTMED